MVVYFGDITPGVAERGADEIDVGELVVRVIGWTGVWQDLRVKLGC